MMRKLTCGVLLLLTIVLAPGCGVFYLLAWVTAKPPSDEYPLDVAIKPDGTVLLSTDVGHIYSSVDQGQTWETYFFFDEIASGVSGSIDNLFVAPDESIWGVYTGPRGRRFLTIAYARSIAVSCPDVRTFQTVGLQTYDSYAYTSGQFFVEQDNSFPLISIEGRLYEVLEGVRCPPELGELGVPPPSGYVSHAAACGDTIYQSSAGRVFRSIDRGQTWLKDWDFYRGSLEVHCQGSQIWILDRSSGEVFRRDSDAETWSELARFSIVNIKTAFLKYGRLFVMGLDESNQLRILAMSNAGEIQKFPAPDVGDDEVGFEFDIAPDGVFWIMTDRAVYRDDVTETWTKVWPHE